jgi:hypothetical protein
LAFADVTAIPVKVFHTIEPSDYFNDYRKVVYHLRTVDPANQARINTMYSNIPMTSFEKKYLGSRRTYRVWVAAKPVVGDLPVTQRADHCPLTAFGVMLHHMIDRGGRHGRPRSGAG